MEQFVGITENPNGSNDTPIGAEFGWNGVPWCAETVSVACKRLGFPLHEAAVIRIVQHAKAGDWGIGWSSRPVRGAAVCFDWSGQGNPNDMHVGIVTDVISPTLFRTIEGNYNNSVQKVLRNMSYVMGFATFPFAGAPSPAQPAQPTPAKPAGPIVHPANPTTIPNFPGRVLRTPPNMQGGDVHTWQAQMKLRGWNITVDGIYGPGSAQICRQFQEEKHLEVDSEVGPITWHASWTESVT
jgi:hypothetical protein